MASTALAALSRPNLSLVEFAARKGCHTDTIRNHHRHAATYACGRLEWPAAYVDKVCNAAPLPPLSTRDMVHLTGYSSRWVRELAQGERGRYHDRDARRLVLKSGRMNLAAVAYFSGFLHPHCVANLIDRELFPRPDTVDGEGQAVWTRVDAAMQACDGLRDGWRTIMNPFTREEIQDQATREPSDAVGWPELQGWCSRELDSIEAVARATATAAAAQARTEAGKLAQERRAYAKWARGDGTACAWFVEQARLADLEADKIEAAYRN